MHRLQGKTAVITGANSGIGLATARLFAAEGAQVFITGRRQAELDEAVRQVGANAFGVRGDVSSMADLDRVFDLVRQEAGGFDVLFANAGGGELAPLAEISEDHFDRTFASNVKGTLFTVQKALPLLRPSSSIILTGSTAASTGVPGFSVYSATKAAIRSFARGWCLELAPRGIRVNVLAPGATSTPGLRGLAASAEQLDGMLAMFAAETPLGRLGAPEEIARAALFLASDDSSFMTGAEMFVDGGSAQI